MRQLSGFDASFLALETPTQCGHVASLTVYSLEHWSNSASKTGSFFEAVAETVRSRIHLLPLLRRRLVEVPFGLDHPYWIADADFDLEFHVRNLALPAPGSDDQLAEQVARIVSRPLDRARPLWELYVIDGLAHDRAAILTKIHHAAIDAVTGVELMGTLLDPDPKGKRVGAPTKPFVGEEPPSTAELAARTALNHLKNPFYAARVQLQALQSATGFAKSAGAGLLASFPVAAAARNVPLLGSLVDKVLGDVSSQEGFAFLATKGAPKTPFNRSITAHRRLAFASVALDDVKRVRKAFEVSLNDVVMAVVGGALRRFLDEQGELPVESLVALMPVTVENGTEADAETNRLAGVLMPLHTNLPDPLGRLAAIHESATTEANIRRAVPARLLTDLAQFAPPAVAARASRFVSRTSVMNRVNPPFNVVISNVPGPKEMLYTAGARLERYYPVPTIAEGLGLAISVQSYRESLDVGVVSCRELVSDPQRIAALIQQTLDEYVAIANELAVDAPTDRTVRSLTARRVSKGNGAATKRRGRSA